MFNGFRKGGNVEQTVSNILVQSKEIGEALSNLENKIAELSKTNPALATDISKLMTKIYPVVTKNNVIVQDDFGNAADGGHALAEYQTIAGLLTAILAIDGAGSGIDADLLDGKHAAAFWLVSDVSDALGDVQMNGAALGASLFVKTDANKKFVTLTADTLQSVGVGGAPSFTNSWVNYGGTEIPAAFRLEYTSGGTYCSIEGMIKNGTVTAAAFTLPVGYRPTATVYFSVVTNTGAGALLITAAGAVQPQTGGTGFFSINVRFRVA